MNLLPEVNACKPPHLPLAKNEAMKTVEGALTINRELSKIVQDMCVAVL